MRIIKENGGRRGIRKKDLATVCEREKLIEFSGTSTQSKYTALDRQILQKLKDRWKAVHIEKVGQNHYVTLTEEGKWFEHILERTEPI